jgi:predicted negative regulator of RcsB-dependent stress response
MVEDYLTDRDQEEALRKWWGENWRWIVAGIVIGLAILAGWQYWQTREGREHRAAAASYKKFEEAVTAKNVQQEETLLHEMAAGHESSPYTQQARLELAKSYTDAGEFDKALPLLRAVADGARDEELAHVAKLRAARVLIQQGKHDEALQSLDPQDAGEFAAQVREVRGDALAAKGDLEGARAEYAAALGANSDATIDRTFLELKQQDIGGSSAKPAAQVAP